jgi:hypothetical protein
MYEAIQHPTPGFGGVDVVEAGELFLLGSSALTTNAFISSRRTPLLPLDYFREDQEIMAPAAAPPAEPPGPVKGSWVAELEVAKDALPAAAAKFDDMNRSSAEDESSRRNAAAALFQAHLRICRAHRMLRQWDRLSVASKKGLALCKSLSEWPTPATIAATAHHASVAFRGFRTVARAELSVESSLNEKGDQETHKDSNEDEDDEIRPPSSDVPPSSSGGVGFYAWMRHNIITRGQSPNTIFLGTAAYQNANAFQDAALTGDVRLMEAIVAMGAAIEYPFVAGNPGRIGQNDVSHGAVVLPSDASTLVMACVVLAIADSTAPNFVGPKLIAPSYKEETLDRIEECAMQLVRLGADPTRKLHVLRDEACCVIFRIPDIDGKSAFQIAAMSKRRALVALMWEHMQMDLKARAAAVHCRCGSRLPWMQCHSTGAGQPPPCGLDMSSRPPRVRCRVSPLARCPCKIAGRTYYKCCWKDNATPMYLMDETGAFISMSAEVGAKNVMRRCLGYRSSAGNDGTYETFVRDHVRRLRETPAHFQELFATLGPKSTMASTWDPAVYAACLERLDEPFFWTDVHWDLDRSALVRQAAEWNQALHKYCDDAGLAGDERDRVFATHRANPCGPCGYGGCDAFEKKVRQFERCAKCKAIA